jgi:hypothetical protein
MFVLRFVHLDWLVGGRNAGMVMQSRLLSMPI